MLKVENLVVRYGMIEAIKGISFEVNDGEIVTLIGANGAGKTTTMHTISGLLKPAEGSSNNNSFGCAPKARMISNSRCFPYGKFFASLSASFSRWNTSNKDIAS